MFLMAKNENNVNIHSREMTKLWSMHPIEYYGTITKSKVDPYTLSFSERY